MCVYACECGAAAAAWEGKIKKKEHCVWETHDEYEGEVQVLGVRGTPMVRGINQVENYLRERNVGGRVD